jgi:uncharacterized protein YndB with AHSA1/START domain
MVKSLFNHPMPSSEPVKGTIVKIYQVNATPERAFRAFTNKEELVMWKADHYEIDPKKGGSYKMGLESEGYAVTGEFLEIVPNEKIVYTWRMNEYDEKTGKAIPNWSTDSPTRVTVRFEKSGDKGTKITLTHDGFPERDEQYYMHEAGWDLLIGRSLKAYLEMPRDRYLKWWAEQEPKWQETWQRMSEDKMKSDERLRVNR